MSGIVKIPPAEFRALATRPPEEVEFYGYDNPVLRGMFVNVINSPIQGLVIALDQIAQKKASA